MKVTALLENTTERGDMLTEHGLSLYIETGSRRILFDTGQSDRFARNADTLGVDLAAVDFAVLSHGHYDHGGGLQTFLERNGNAPVYLNRFAFEPHYRGAERYIGLDPNLQSSGRLRFVGDEAELCGGCTLHSCNGNARNRPIDSGGLRVREGDRFLPEDFRHEQYLLIEEDGKRVLFSGCSHKGVLEIARWFRPDVLIGGFHFSHLPLDEALADCARELDGFPTAYYTCHCTGCEQFRFLRRHMRRLEYLSCGQTITL